MTATEKRISQKIDRTIERLYLSYVNDFLTVRKFAKHYSLSMGGAEKIINIGRTLNQTRKV